MTRKNATYQDIDRIATASRRAPWLVGIMAVCAVLIGQGAAGDGLQCLDHPYAQGGNSGERRVHEMVQWLRSSLDPGADMLRALDTVRPEICLDDRLFGVEAYLSTDDGRLVLKKSLPPGLMQAALLHELRHLHQVHIGVCPDSTLSMRETGRVTLAMEADASAVSVQIAWELKQAGAPGTWNAVTEWPTHADIAQAFEKEITKSGDIGRATAQAFAQWYASAWRREEYYRAACSDYLDRQDAAHAIPRYGTAPTGLLDSICMLPNGEPYRCTVPDDAGW